MPVELPPDGDPDQDVAVEILREERVAFITRKRRIDEASTAHLLSPGPDTAAALAAAQRAMQAFQRNRGARRRFARDAGLTERQIEALTSGEERAGRPDVRGSTAPAEGDGGNDATDRR